MKGSLEKYLYFNTISSKNDRPRDEGEETDTKKRKQAAEDAITAKKSYQRLFLGETATTGDVAASQTIIKVQGNEGIKVGGSGIGDVVNVVRKQEGEPVKVLPGFLDDHVVTSIGTFDSDGFYPITLTANVAGALDFSTDIGDFKDKELMKEYYYEFAGNDGSNNGTGDKDTSRLGQQVCYPVERLKGMVMVSAGKEYKEVSGATREGGNDLVVLIFEPLLGSPSEFENSGGEENWDQIFLEITKGKQKEVVESLCRRINGARNFDNGFIVVFDDIEQDFVSTNIVACHANLAVNK